MRPVTNQIYKTLLTVCLMVASVPVVQSLRGTSVRRTEESVAVDAHRGGRVTVHAVGRGKPFLNLRDGREMSVMYRGDRAAADPLQNRTAQSRSLASADFDHNGTPDVVVGFSDGGGGLITLQRGNPDAFAPTDDAVFVRLQQGYDPPALLPGAEVYQIPVSPDFLVTGNFNSDSDKDVLVAAQGGGLYLLTGDGRGGLGAPQPISLPGAVTAMAAGQFRAADVFTDIAVGVSGSDGHSLLIFDDAATGFTDAVVQQALAEPASAIEFGGLDGDPFLDVAVAAGRELLVVHGWGRKTAVTAESRVERVTVGGVVSSLAVGEFAWDRAGHSEIAALSTDGAIYILQNARAETRPFSAVEAAARVRGKVRPPAISPAVDIESLPSWQPGRADRWRHAGSWLPANDCEGECEDASEGARDASSATRLLKTTLSYREMNDLMVIGGRQSRVEIVHPTGPADAARRSFSATGETPSTILETTSAPVAVLALPRKLNGVTEVLMLSSTSTELSVVVAAPNTTITVDRTDDPSGAALTAASACTAAANDCSLRGAFNFANLPANNNTTISLPANTYILSINGTSQGGCDGNTVGDLGANQTMSLIGASAATTIIRQTGTGPANDGDRIMCMNEVFAIGLVYNFSGVTFVGGREGTAAGTGAVLGGAGIIGGELNNSLTLTNVVFANNQETVAGSANLGGGGLQITGGSLIITNSTFGGSSAPGAYADRTSTNTANLQTGSGGGLAYTPSSPQHAGGSGTLTITGSTFSRNTAAGIGGGGADLLIFAFASPGGIGSGSATIETSTFSNNQATGSGGGIVVESLPTTVATTSLTNNSATNGGGIYVGGGSLHLNGASPSVTFTGNTVTGGGSSVSTAAPVTVSGTNVTIGGSIQVSTGGSWTNNAGSTLNPTDVVIVGGTLTMNNSTMNVSGNLTIAPAPVVGATFNGGSGTVNLAGNFILNAGGVPATTFNAGTGTFNFNGNTAQSITNGTSITFFNLTDSNVTQPLTVNNSLAVNGTLNVNGANAILSPVAGAVISGTGTLTGTGTARASRVAATPDFLSQYTITNKTLTNLTIDYTGAGNQTVNNAPAYSRLVISGSGIKTLQGNTSISGNLTINPATTLASGNFNFSLGGNWTNSGTFTPGTGTVTFAGTTGIQTLAGNTTFFNLTLNNAGATTNFGTTTTTIGNDLTATAGTMDGGTSTVIFTGVTDNAGSIGGVSPKNFHSLQINSPAVISNTSGGTITIENNYSNTGTFTQAAAQGTIFAVDNTADGAHGFAGGGTTTFGNLTITGGNTVDAGTHSFNLAGSAFTASGAFTGNASTVTFNGAAAQTIAGDGAKNFSGLLVNNASGVQLANGAGAVDASVSGLLTLTTDFTVAAGAILQQSGTSAGVADVLGTVRRTDLGAVARSFGNLNNAITINSGTAPTQLDLNLVKTAPGTFPAAVKVVPRDITLTPTGGSGISATVRLRYIDPAELTGAGITESRLALWKNIGGTWTPQGGTPDIAANFVNLTGISSFSEWAIAEASDLTLSKANNVSGSAVTGQAWTWTLTASNSGAPATFTSGQTILSDNLPNSNLTYGTPTVQNVSNVTGSGNISCSIVGSDLTCTATGGSVTFDSNLGVSNFSVVFSATPQAAGTYQNPRSGGGIAQIDPTNAIAESNESNNSPTTNTVTVGKASTTTTIASDNPDPSIFGQLVTVQWSVAVNAPGSLGAALTGNVTVSDGTNQCVAAVSAGQCDITFTSAGPKSITATYAGDTNYNGSASTPATTHTVDKANTTTTITSDLPDPSTPGQSVIVQWAVTVTAPGAGTPTGDVTVSDGVDSCTAPAATGQCTLALNTTGTRTLTATYPGDTNFNASDVTESHQVCQSSLVTTAADSGAGSLRQIIAAACDGAAITFDSAGVFATPQTIALTSGELVIDRNLTVNAGSSQVTVSGNNASRVFNVNAGKAFTIIGLTISGGQNAGSGGGIVNDGTLTVVDSTLSGNNAGTDGGAISASASATSVTLINSTISGNNANGSGGGIAVLGGTFTSINATFTNNRADNDNDATGTGGGVFHGSGTTTLRNTIVAGNFNEDGASDAADDISGTVDPASSFNLIGPGGSGGLTNGVNNNQVGAASPGLGPLADNGGRTQTHALLIDSPALDAGDNAAATDAGLTTDQRGFGRVRDAADAGTTATVDIGAYEADPTIENVGNQSTLEDVQLVVNFRTGDDTIAFDSLTATSSNTILVPNASLLIGGSGSDRTLTINPAVNMSGLTTITVTAQKTIGGTTQAMADTFDVTVIAVNDPPTIDPIADPPAIGEDAAAQSVNFSGVSAGGGETQTLVVTAVSDNTALIPNPIVTYTSADATGSLSYTPVPNAFGSAIITVTVNDGVAMASRTFTVTVTAADDAPTISDVADQAIDEDTPTSPLPFTVFDADGLAGVTVTATSSNTTLVPDANLLLGGAGNDRLVTATPDPDRFGSTTITLTVNDGVSTASSSFVLTVNAVNDPPTLDAIANPAEIPEDAPLQTIALTGIGAGGIGESDTLVVTAVSSNTAVIPHPAVSYTSPDLTGSLSYTPVPDASGSATITVTVNDGALSTARTFVVTVGDANDAPTIGVIANQTIAEDTAVGPLAFTIGDPDGLAGLSVTASSSDTTLVPNANLLLGGGGSDRSITVTPALNQSGSTTITLTVSDGTATAESTFVLTVTPVADPPTITAIGDQALDPGESTGPLAFTIDDPDGLAGLTVTATSSDLSVIANANVVLGGSGAARTVTVTATSNTGSTLITVSVSDGVLSASTSFTVTVGRVPPAPLNLQAMVEGRRVDLSWQIPAEDGAADHAATSFRIEVGSESGDSDVATFTTGVTTMFTIAELAPGEYFIRVRGVNAVGVGSPSNEVQVIITGPPGPDAPQQLRATITGSTVQLDWEAPPDGLPVDGYQVEASYLINLTSIVVDTIAPQLVANGVGDGIYYARVRGIRGGAMTSASNEIVVIVGPDSCTAAPQPPGAIALAAAGNFVAVQWLPPGGPQPVERYIVSVGSGPGLSDRGAFEFGAATTVTGAFVPDGTYVVRVAAANRCGTSVPTAEASITIGGPPPELPGPPGALTATVTGSTVRLDWTAPTTGGAPTRYIIEATTAGGVPVATLDTGNPSTTLTYEGAPAGVYVIWVRAANGAGAGEPSTPVVLIVGP